MNETVKNLVEGIIKMKCTEVQELGFSDMEVDDVIECDMFGDKILKLQDKLKKTLSKEQWDLFNEYIDTEVFLEAIHEGYMFNRGVKVGLNELSFIGEELGNKTVML